MKKFFAVAFIFCLNTLAMSQITLTPTTSIRVFGEIEKETTVTFESLRQMNHDDAT